MTTALIYNPGHTLGQTPLVGPARGMFMWHDIVAVRMTLKPNAWYTWHVQVDRINVNSVQALGVHRIDGIGDGLSSPGRAKVELGLVSNPNPNSQPSKP